MDNVDIGPEFSTSDHKSVFFTIECNTGEHNNSYEKVPDFRRADFDKLRTILENTDWSEIYGIQDVEQAWNMFTDILGNAITECVPMRDRRPANNSKPKWWNIDIRNILLAKKRAFFFLFFYEWEYRTGTMCPFSSLHPLKKGKEV